MKSPQPALTQKSRPTAVGMLVGTRFQPALLAAIDEWRKQQPDLPTRPEAVRRLVDVALKQATEHGNVSSKTKVPVIPGHRGGRA